MPVPCQNCQNSPCTKVCPVGATYYSEDNIVLIDQNRCIGCRICLASCPYERRFFNWYDPPVTEEEKKIPYSPDYNIPHRRGVAEKCVWCRHRTKMGMVPACVEACTRAGMKALWFGDAAQDVVSNGVDTARLSTMIQGRGAYRSRMSWDTQVSYTFHPEEVQLRELKFDIEKRRTFRTNQESLFVFLCPRKHSSRNCSVGRLRILCSSDDWTGSHRNEVRRVMGLLHNQFRLLHRHKPCRRFDVCNT